MTVARAVRELNLLKAQRVHLQAQVDAGVDTKQATCAQAGKALALVEESIAELGPVVVAAAEPRKKRRARGGRTHVPMPRLDQQVQDDVTHKEGDMAKKSNAAQLEEVLVQLRKAEKSAGTTKWALSGAGAKANPPSKEKKAHLTEKLAGEQAKIADLRAQRDALKAKVKA